VRTRRSRAEAAEEALERTGPLIAATLRRSFRAWGLPGLAREVRFEYSRRLRRSLALCYEDRLLIRLHISLARPANGELLREIVCHEAAHIAARKLYGRNVPPHGPEWSALVDRMGYLPRLDFRTPHERRGRDGRRLPPVVFEHACDSCRVVRVSSTPDRRWRCARCISVGRSGRLEIRSRRPLSGRVRRAS
jgi:predicted SprT family Zn-dependent metalloprotease